jgi:hypothetical protein
MERPPVNLTNRPHSSHQQATTFTHIVLSPSSSLESSKQHGADPSDESLVVIVPQERGWLRTLTAWAVVIAWVGWLIPSPQDQDPAAVVGIVVDVNFALFCAAPCLQTVMTVVAEENCESIHAPPMIGIWRCSLTPSRGPSLRGRLAC